MALLIDLAFYAVMFGVGVYLGRYLSNSKQDAQIQKLNAESNELKSITIAISHDGYRLCNFRLSDISILMKHQMTPDMRLLDNHKSGLDVIVYNSKKNT